MLSISISYFFEVYRLRNSGVIVTIILFPMALLIMLRMLFMNVFKTEKSETSEWVLTPVVPGVNVPFADIKYYVITLILCSLIHEFGHALAASREDLQVYGVGFLLVFIIPIAYVSLNSEQLSQLPTMKQLRILCAGLWHNIILAVISFLIFFSSSLLLAPLYSVDSGIIVKSIHPKSPLLGSTGLYVHDSIYKVNECQVDNINDWYYCLLDTIKHVTPGYCVDELIVQEHDRSIPDLKKQKNAANCCKTDDESHGYLCFEYVENLSKLILNSCLPARTIIEKSYDQCQSSFSCLKQDTCCVRPVLGNNKTKVVQIKRRIGKDILYIGDPADIYKTVIVSNWVPKFKLIGSELPEFITTLSKYITVLSAGQAIINVIPCFWFDGQYILIIFFHKLLGSRSHPKTRQTLSFIITCIGTCILLINLMYAFRKKF
ncbi:membrane-bound transcription factor site-2 protease isoform X2 [Aphidius gifuensis]|uniref:membrane-bound transcription factor site-2 protease isoform X2 n=1 Tax=Aphidius gifuensis TaxID=684658 RepID=UPI001CDBBE26|nr:membrane-bound transcription factor site-2 protease isoform X2 [Aphidius gifuensis]